LQVLQEGLRLVGSLRNKLSIKYIIAHDTSTLISILIMEFVVKKMDEINIGRLKV
jgi:hypothetical protein